METLKNEIININPKALDEKLQVVTKNHLLIISIIFAFVSTFLYRENKITQGQYNTAQDKNFERIIVINEKQTVLQQETNSNIKELKNVTIENGNKLTELVNKKR